MQDEKVSVIVVKVKDFLNQIVVQYFQNLDHIFVIAETMKLNLLFYILPGLYKWVPTNHRFSGTTSKTRVSF